MAVYFNDLTLDSVPQQNLMLLREFRHTWVEFSRATDKKFKRLITNDDGMEKLADAVSSGEDPELMSFFFSIFTQKFRRRPDDDFTEGTDDYFNGSEYSINLPTGRKECPMMGWAHLNRSVTFGFPSLPLWHDLCHKINEYSLEDGESIVDVLCITTCDHVRDSRVQGWILSKRDFENVPDPEPCLIPPEKKIIKYREDHGKELLRDFAAKLVRHQYVRGVSGSLAFDSTTKRFILKCYDDGSIDVRLHWTKMGCGLKVQTVGKSYRQTMMIADVLQEKFDHKS